MKGDFNSIVKYKVTAVCAGPMHIGSGEEDKTDILVHPVSGIPFIQASSLAGAFRECCEQQFPLNGQETSDMKKVSTADIIFGTSSLSEDAADDGSGRICFTDGEFLTDEETFHMELRPRVRIDRESGTVSGVRIGGTDREMGLKFETEYISAGSRVCFYVYLYGTEYLDKLEELFGILKSGSIQIGGMKSSGCGCLTVSGVERSDHSRIEGNILRHVFNMKDSGDRKLWMREDSMSDGEYRDGNFKEELSAQKPKANAYEVEIIGRTEGVMLVKSISTSEFGEGAPDAVNIRNGMKEYIIPGTSFKGVIRSQMEKISSYMSQEGFCGNVSAEELIADAFGTERNKKKREIDIENAENDGETVRTGNLYFQDTIVGDRESNDDMLPAHRIHIDKFTGGVMHGALFAEKNIAGNMTFQIGIHDNNHPDRTCGLLLMALRDLAVGTTSVGSGYGVGKGIIHVSTIDVTTPDGHKAKLDFEKNRIDDSDGIVRKCMTALKGAEG